MEDESLPRQGEVPKFASFRPRAHKASKHPDSKTQLPTVFAPKDQDTLPNQSNTEASSNRLEIRNQRFSGRSTRPLDLEKHDSLSTTASDRNFQVSNSTQNPIFADWTGDGQNLVYRALDRHRVPSYFRIGNGILLGSNKRSRIDRSRSDEKSISLSSEGLEMQSGKSGLSLSKGSKNKIESSEEQHVQARKHHHSAISEGADYIPVTVPALLEENGEGGGSEDEVSLQLLLPKDGIEQSDTHNMNRRDSDGYQLASEKRSSESSEMHTSYFKKRKTLLDAVESNTASFDAWLNLINLQDEALDYPDNLRPQGRTMAEVQSNAEIKILLYQKAIKNVQDTHNQETLVQGMMRAGADVWEASELSKKWRKTLRQYPNSIKLRIGYLDYIQSAPSAEFSQVRQAFYDLLSLLKEQRSASLQVDHDDLYLTQLYAVLRMTLFMREGGFMEHAIAVWQALLEYEFYKPTELRDSSSEILHSRFKEFWNSEAPRIGEPDARGWLHFSTEDEIPAQSQEHTMVVDSELSGLFQKWAEIEHAHYVDSRRPARTVDHTSENDPYRIVLFSDIEVSLFDSPSALGRQVLVDTLLCFCHLPPYLSWPSCNRSRLWFRDQYAHNGNLYNYQTPLLPGLYKSGDPLESLQGRSRDTIHSPFNFPIPDYHFTLDTLLPTHGSWFSVFKFWNKDTFTSTGPVIPSWIRLVLKAILATGEIGDFLVDYYLAFEINLSPETVQKTAKSLLRAQPSSLRLYNIYSRIEYCLGNTDVAEKVLQKALSLKDKVAENMQHNAISLCRTQLWQQLESDESEEALEGLVRFSTPSVNNLTSVAEKENGSHDIHSPTVRLRARKMLTAARDNMLSMNLILLAVEYAECLIFLAYLGNSRSVEAASTAFKENLGFLVNKFPLNLSIGELMRQSFAKILYWHATHERLCPPAILRAFLTESIEAFPKNSMFLSLYAWNESRLWIEDRVRSIVKNVVFSNNNVKTDRGSESAISYLFAVYVDLNRGIIGGSTHESVRKAFEHALQSESGAHWAGMWKLYFEFEHSRGETQKARNVFYRAIAACPCVKEIYMLAFRCLARDMTDRELRSVYDRMVEKGLRIHVPIEDVGVQP